MKTFAGYGLVGILAFLIGAAWQSDLFYPEAPPHASPSLTTKLEQPPEPDQGAVANRAIEHFRDVIQLGIRERQTQAKRKHEAATAAKRRALDLARLEKEKHQTQREKTQQQLLLATQKAQQAQTEFAQERTEQARLETQWLLDEKRHRNQELVQQKAEEKYNQEQDKRQRLLDLHAEHQLIATIQARKAKAHQRKLAAQRERERCEVETRSRTERTRQQATASRPTSAQSRSLTPKTISPAVQPRSAVKSTKEPLQQQAQKQKALMRSAWKK